LFALVADGHAGHQRVQGPDGRTQLIVGIALPAIDAAYFEVFPLNELQRTLSTLRYILLAATLVTVGAAAVFGRYAASRVVRPLEPVATAAQLIAGGEFGTRLPAGGDRDLGPLTDAFNTMAASLEERIARDARFASDVSHELRSPLAVLAASIEIIERRRAELSPTVEATVDVLAERVADFQTLVLALLELSRLDSHVTSIDPEPIDVRVFVRQLLASRAPQATLRVDEDVPAHVVADRQRLAQVLANIVDNAGRYAGGTTNCHVHVTAVDLVIDLDDSGPGVDVTERKAIFERFARGSAGRRAGSSSGTGLGLPLAAEHVKLHGGHVHVTDAPGGGARFRVIVPRSDP
jgi:signal transduction histidine kinase